MIPVDLTPRPARELWTPADAAHLLRRTGFGATAAEIAAAHRAGLAATLDRLLAPQPETDEFALGERALRSSAMASGSPERLKHWWLYRMMYSANPLVEKMTLLWHNHFATSVAKVEKVKLMADQNDLFRQQALGNFRPLLHGIARDSAMLLWLDSNANRRRAPNENFARELMELFALGIGNYTEKDIRQAAKAFSGWFVRNEQFFFDRTQHDFGPKTVFGKIGAFDGGEIVDLCLAKPACPRFIADKLIKAYLEPSPPAAFLQAVADSIRRHDFAMTPVLRSLLGSRRFFAPEVRGRIIKGPIDLVLGTLHTLQIQANLETAGKLLAALGQDVFAPPTVKGWEGGRLWINSASLLQRVNFAGAAVGGGAFGPPAELASLAVGKSDVAARVRQWVEMLHAPAIADSSVQPIVKYLKADESPDRARGALHLLMALPEYQLM